MAKKYGKTNVVKVNPLAYNIALFGESGIGKSTLAFELQQKLAGKEGYLHLNVGLEDGVSAIQGIVYEDVPNWTTFENIVKDIVENKEEDYKDLKIITIDTIDELENIAVKEVIRLHNLKNPKEKTDSFNKAFGGFNRPHEKLEELVLEQITKLREVGVSVFIIGHVKKKTKTDPLTETEYDIITAKMSNRLFVAIQTKLHVLGLAVIDRTIKEDIVGKDFVGKDIVSKKVKTEKRVIKFRDDSFAVESKSRFADIIPEVPFSADNFINAITDAIKASFKSEEDLKNAKITQEKESMEKISNKLAEIVKEMTLVNENGTLEDMIDKLKVFYTNGTDEDKEKIKSKFKELGIGKFDNLYEESYETVLSIFELTK